MCDQCSHVIAVITCDCRGSEPFATNIAEGYVRTGVMFAGDCLLPLARGRCHRLRLWVLLLPSPWATFVLRSCSPIHAAIACCCGVSLLLCSVLPPLFLPGFARRERLLSWGTFLRTRCDLCCRCWESNPVHASVPSDTVFLWYGVCPGGA